MGDYFKRLFSTLQYSFGELFLTNILWGVLLLPIVTLPPAFAGLYYATNELANERKVTYEVFFEGFRKYWKVSYIWFLLNLFIVGFLVFNINLTLQGNEIWFQNLSYLYTFMIAIWGLLQIYTLPLLMQQEEPKLMLALRNSGVIWLKHLGFSVILTLLIGLVLALSFYALPVVFIFTGSYIAFFSNLGLVYLIEQEQNE